VLLSRGIKGCYVYFMDRDTERFVRSRMEALTDAVAADVIPFRPRVLQAAAQERYVTCLPLVPLSAAAGAFSDPQHVQDDGWEWVAVETQHRLRRGMFVAQVVGKSMEPLIPDGAWCVFSAPVQGTRQGKVVLVMLRDALDPESNQRFTVKRYESERVADEDTWRHATVTLKPVNLTSHLSILAGLAKMSFRLLPSWLKY
jgi:uncharacterized protein